MDGTSRMEPAKSTVSEVPPSCIGQVMRNLVSYTTVVGRPSRSAASVVSKLETMRPSQPPFAPDHIEPGRNSRQPRACHPDRSVSIVQSSVAVARTGASSEGLWRPESTRS